MVKFARLKAFRICLYLDKASGIFIPFGVTLCLDWFIDEISYLNSTKQNIEGQRECQCSIRGQNLGHCGQTILLISTTTLSVFWDCGKHNKGYLD
jgi:hypothetical protein